MAQCFKIFENNFLDLDRLALATVTSEQADFPASNIYTKQRRSKLWRSNNHFRVSSSNRQIVFQETDNVDLTATIATGSYSNFTDFAQAVRTALEIAGSSVYTVTQNSNLRINIASDRSGGGGVFKLMTTDAGFTAADLLGFSTLADLPDAANHDADLIRIHTSEILQWDFGLATNPQYFIISGLRNKAITLTDSATITLKGNHTNNFTGTTAYSQVLTYHEENIFVGSETGLHTEPLRWWALEVEDKSNPQGYIEFGIAHLGNFMPLTGTVQFGLRKNFVDRSTTVFSESGQTFSDARERSMEFNVTYAALDKSDVNRIRDFFDEFGTAIPFYVQMDDGAAWHTNSNRSIRYVKFDREPVIAITNPDFFRCEMVLREEL